MALRAGEWVEVRSKEEILRSLDNNGRLEKLPFTPQMFQYCGQKFKVEKRAHKTCDTVNIDPSGRRMENAVHLELRCDGKAYGGCQTSCPLFWKEAWLKPVSEGGVDTAAAPAGQNGSRTGAAVCTEEIVQRSTWAPDPQSPDGKRYFCQATELLQYTTHLPWWDARQYVEDYTSGNSTLGRLFKGFVFANYQFIARKHKFGIGAPFRWLYDRFQELVGGVPYPKRRGLIPDDQLTPLATLNLQPGELVRVKSYKDILATLNTKLKNRGMAFDADQVPYCGGVYRVKTNVERFMNEKTGRLMSLKTPAVILEGVWCRSCFSHLRMGCPRALHSWWREIWLERVEDRRATAGRRVTTQANFSGSSAPSQAQHADVAQ